MNIPGNRGLDDIFLWVGFDNNSVLAQLFLYKDDLFRSVDNKVTTGIKRTFIEDAHLSRRFIRQHTFRTAEHDRNSSDGDCSSDNPLPATDILKVNENGCGVCSIS